MRCAKVGVLATVLFFVAAPLFGCASSVEIDSQPQGATVEINGEEIGETPVVYTDSATILESHDVVVRLEGYETVEATLERDGEVNQPALVGGLVGIVVWPLLASWLWVFDYPEYMMYEMAGVADPPEEPLEEPPQQQPDDQQDNDVPLVQSPRGNVVVERDGDTITFVLVPTVDVGVGEVSD